MKATRSPTVLSLFSSSFSRNAFMLGSLSNRVRLAIVVK